MRLWRNQGFAVFWSACTISLAGTGITTVVLPVLVYGMTHSPAWVAALGLIEAVPYLSLGLLAGAVADRMNRKKIMVGCDAIAALLLAAIPAAAALHLLGVAQVLIVALGIATVYVWFDAANFGTLPALVDRAELPVAASLIGSSGQVALLCAPTVGAALLNRHVAGLHRRLRRGLLSCVSAAAAVDPAALPAAAARAQGRPNADPRGHRRGLAVPLASADDPYADVRGLLRLRELGRHVRPSRGLRQPRTAHGARGRAARVALQRRGTRRPARRGLGPDADQASGDRSPRRS